MSKVVGNGGKGSCGDWFMPNDWLVSSCRRWISVTTAIAKMQAIILRPSDVAHTIAIACLFSISEKDARKQALPAKFESNQNNHQSGKIAPGLALIRNDGSGALFCPLERRLVRCQLGRLFRNVLLGPFVIAAGFSGLRSLSCLHFLHQVHVR